jgi:hypothetical protein
LGAPNATLILACRYVGLYPGVVLRAGHGNQTVTSPADDACQQAEGGLAPPTPTPAPEFSGTAPWFTWGMLDLLVFVTVGFVLYFMVAPRGAH